MELLTGRVLLVANPAARRAAKLRVKALAAFARAGVRCDTVLTEYPGHAAELCGRLAAEYDAVFTLGGDGTAMEVVGALAGRALPVGILPGGTGNLVARALGVPRRVRHAVPRLLRGAPTALDLGQLAEGRCFAFAAGVGIDAEMIERTPTKLKRRLGVLAYALAAARAVLRPRPFVVRATVDGERIEGRAAAVMIVNFGAVLDELITLGPGIRQDDGLLDLCIFAPRTFGEAVSAMWRLVRKDFRPHPALRYHAGRRFRVETEPPRRVEADGELLGVTPFDVEVRPRAALLLVPARD